MECNALARRGKWGCSCSSSRHVTSVARTKRCSRLCFETRDLRRGVRDACMNARDLLELARWHWNVVRFSGKWKDARSPDSERPICITNFKMEMQRGRMDVLAPSGELSLPDGEWNVTLCFARSRFRMWKWFAGSSASCWRSGLFVKPCSYLWMLCRLATLSVLGFWLRGEVGCGCDNSAGEQMATPSAGKHDVSRPIEGIWRTTSHSARPTHHDWVSGDTEYYGAR